MADAVMTNDHSNGPNHGPVISAAMPPDMAKFKQQSVDEVLDIMNRMPLFMTDMDKALESGESIPELDALKALAYEGTRSEIAINFREQGNEAAKSKLWIDARQFYDRAIEALRMTDEQLQIAKGYEGPSDFEVLDVDEEVEKSKVKETLEACLVNRALCELQLKNYGSCIRDCAATLKVNSKNVKAWYRSASACLALNKIVEAEDSCQRGLEIDATNAALLDLFKNIRTRKARLEAEDQTRKSREERKKLEEETLAHALNARNIKCKSGSKISNPDDGSITLSNPINAASTLKIPVMFLYPIHGKTDYIQQFGEDESIEQHLDYILPLPWDDNGQYTFESVDVYVETIHGGLMKAGKKMALLRIITADSIVLDNYMLQFYVVPQDQAQTWIAEYKAKQNRR